MSGLAVSGLMAGLGREYADLMAFDAWYEKEQAERPGADFVFGNPQEMPLPALVDALRTWLEPRDKSHFAYKMNVGSAQHAVAAGLTRRRGVAYADDDVILTTGAFAGLSSTLRAICDPGDEVVYLSPPWFFYSGQIKAAGGVPVRVNVRTDDFDIDLDAISRALTARTRGIIVNSPHNPSGRLYSRATLDRLARILTEASARHGRPVYLISDEAYSRILFDGRRYESPAESYPHTIVVYTYGKQLLIPGERVGYLALPPLMPDGERRELRDALTMALLVSGWSFPNAVLQYALPELEDLSIDLEHLHRKRTRLVDGLRAAGYELPTPEGTFYLIPKCPWPDDVAFARALAAHAVYVLPGTLGELPGRFRLSLTASDAMIEQALPVLAAMRTAPPPR